MPKKTFEHVKHKVRNASHIDPKHKEELEALIAKAKEHLDDVPPELKEDAESLAHFVHITVHELLKPEQDPELIEYAEKGMKRALDKFETGHPKLFLTLQSLAVALSGLGV